MCPQFSKYCFILKILLSEKVIILPKAIADRFLFIASSNSCNLSKPPSKITGKFVLLIIFAERSCSNPLPVPSKWTYVILISPTSNSVTFSI